MGKGGSGIVIIRYLTSEFFETTISGVGNTITTDGDYSVATFIIGGTFDVVNFPYVNISGTSKISGNSKF